MIRAAALSLLVLLVTPPAKAWVVDECPAEQLAAQRHYEQSVRNAKIGSPLYLPHPYPQTLSEVMADLEFAFANIWGKEEVASASEQDRKLVDAVTNRSHTVSLYRVEDWTHVRCAETIGREPVFLVVVRNKEGRTLARIGVQGSGHWASGFVFPAETPPSEIETWDSELRPASSAASSWRSVLGAEPTDAQWVATQGSVRCDLLRPCLAFRAKGQGYVVQQGGLFRLDLEGPRMHTHEVLTWQPVSEGIRTLRRQVEPGRRHLVSVGFDRTVFAVRVLP